MPSSVGKVSLTDLSKMKRSELKENVTSEEKDSGMAEKSLNIAKHVVQDGCQMH